MHYNRNSMGQFFQVNWFFGRISKNFFQKITHISIKTPKIAQNRPGPFFGKNSPKKRLPGGARKIRLRTGPGQARPGPVPAQNAAFSRILEPPAGQKVSGNLYSRSFPAGPGPRPRPGPARTRPGGPGPGPGQKRSGGPQKCIIIGILWANFFR